MRERHGGWREGNFGPDLKADPDVAAVGGAWVSFPDSLREIHRGDRGVLIESAKTCLL